MRIFTIGFTKKTAEEFFETLRLSGAKRLVDVRLKNVSQLAGFAKRQDLAYFLNKICDMEYIHLPSLAPTQEMLDEFKKRKGEWEAYERSFLDLMRERQIEESVPRALMADSCLLCSEDQPLQCHRRLVVEYLRGHWGDVEIVHLEK
jgi:uncharacterized protein (DUF488 family)